MSYYSSESHNALSAFANYHTNVRDLKPTEESIAKRRRRTYTVKNAHFIFSIGTVIPIPIDQNPCAQSRMPMDMISHGRLASVFQAWQQ